MSQQSFPSQSTEQPVDQKPSTTTRQVCPDCGHARLDHGGSDTYCSECGVVVEEEDLDRTRPGWRDDAARQVGPGASTQWLQRGTCVGGGTDTNAAMAGRLRRFNRRLGTGDRTLYRGLRELRAVCEELELGTGVRERAGYLYRKAVANRLLAGRGIEEFAAAAVLVAVREADQPVTIAWLADAAFATRSEIATAHRVLTSEFGLRALPPDPHEFVPRLVTELGLAAGIERAAVRVIDRAREANLTTGKHPTGMAGAAIYAVARREGAAVTQEEVANAAGVDLVTISRRWRDLNDTLGLIGDD